MLCLCTNANDDAKLNQPMTFLPLKETLANQTDNEKKVKLLPDPLLNHVISKHALVIPLRSSILLIIPLLPLLQALVDIGVNPAPLVLRDFNLAETADANTISFVVVYFRFAGCDESFFMLHLCVSITRVLEKDHTQQKLKNKQDKKNDEEDNDHCDGGDDVVRGPYVPGAGVERVVKRIAVGSAAKGVADE